MNTEVKYSKSAAEQLKEMREKISFDIKNMNPAELKKYIDEKLKQHPKADRKKTGK